MNKRLVLSLFAVMMVCKLFAQDSISMPASPVDVANRPIHWQDPKTITNPMQLYEDSLMYFADSLYYTSDISKRELGNNAFIKIMRGMLKQPNSFSYPFDTLQTKIAIVQPKNKAFRIYQWEMINAEGLSRYYGVIQLPNGKINPLIDVSTQVTKQMEDTILTNARWFGAIYYNVLEQPTAAGTVYFLLGLNASNTNSERKIVECMRIDNNGEVSFGAPMFQSMVSKTPKICNRFIAEYQKDSHITLNWDNEQGMIIYDHLESTIGDNAKRYTFVSDGTYDGLRWNGKQWLIVPNAVQITNTPDGLAPVQQGSTKKELIMPEDMETPEGKPVEKKKKK
jgi:hypothetical protein